MFGKKFWFDRRKFQQVGIEENWFFDVFTVMYRYIQLMYRFIRLMYRYMRPMHRCMLGRMKKNGAETHYASIHREMYRFIISYASIHDAHASMHAAVMHRFMWMHRYILGRFWKMRKIQLFRKRFRS